MDPCVGLALGLLWAKRPPFAVSRHVPPTRVAPYTRRPGFPTWSWTSIVGEIYNEVDKYRQSILGEYLRASTEISATNEAYRRFWLHVDGHPTPLQKVIQRTNSNVLIEPSPDLLVEGDIVRIIIRSPGSREYCFCRQDDKVLEPRGGVAQFDFPPPEGYRTWNHGTVALGEKDFRDALALVQWHDSQAKSKKRIVMMLLEWVADGRAERRGLLSDYGSEWNSELLKLVPRMRRKFILQ